MSWQFPTSWISSAPDLPRYSTQRLNAFHSDPRELVHQALLFRCGLSPKEVALDTTAVNMFNKLLQDKALGEGQNPRGRSSSKCPLAKVLLQLQRFRFPKGNARRNPCCLMQRKPKPLSASSLNLRVADFVKGLFGLSGKSFMEALFCDQVMNLLASCASKTILLIGVLLERGGPIAEDAQRRTEELQEKELKHETNVVHLKFKISSLHDRWEQTVLKLQEYPSTEVGKKRFDELWTNLADFKKLEEF
ncbi:UNVERIFIED_CONTAM: hypothetical protein Sindi_1390000 [Sesamum indicum]